MRTLKSGLIWKYGIGAATLIAAVGCGGAQTPSEPAQPGGEAAERDTAETEETAPPDTSTDAAKTETAAVTVDIHMMSKCPFAVKTLQALLAVKEKMGAALDVNIYYIGRSINGELTSMHGQDEVEGDLLNLCAEQIGGKEKMYTFAACQMENWRAIPQGWGACAQKVELDEEQIRACAASEEGSALLSASFFVSDRRGISGSPTLLLNGEPYKGGRSELSFSRNICAAMPTADHPFCAAVPQPVPVPITIVSDARCDGSGCDPARFISFLKHTFEGAVIRELDYGEPEGKALTGRSGQPYLPIAIFGPSVVSETVGYERLKPRLVPVDGSEELVYPLGIRWDPTREICTDEIDNTGNGKIDCRDPDCAEYLGCRKNQPRKLDLFLMSQCPYGAKVAAEVQTVLKGFGNRKKQIDFELNYIGNITNDGFSSMHGDAEVEEDKRQLCAQQHYAKNYRFMQYVACRSRDYRSEDWQACAVGGINPKIIEKCASGDEGAALLSASFQKSQALGISASPSWILNNRLKMEGRTPCAVKKAFCTENETVPTCKAALSTVCDGEE